MYREKVYVNLEPKQCFVKKTLGFFVKLFVCLTRNGFLFWFHTRPPTYRSSFKNRDTIMLFE